MSADQYHNKQTNLHCQLVKSKAYLCMSIDVATPIFIRKSNLWNGAYACTHDSAHFTKWKHGLNFVSAKSAKRKQTPRQVYSIK